MTNSELMELLMRVTAKTKRHHGHPKSASDKHQRPLRHGYTRILTHLKNGDLSPTEMAERLDIRMQSLSEAVSRLEELDYLEKIPDETDRRKVILHLTPLGAQAAEDGLKRNLAFSSTFFDALSLEERDQLGVLLTKLAKDGEAI